MTHAANKYGVALPIIHLGDVVQMLKQHPCGSDLWRITRTGMDFGMKCEGCGHAVMIPRAKFERMARAIVQKGSGAS